MKAVYRVMGIVSVSCWTDVEAASEAEALDIASERPMAGLCHAPFSGEADECFHIEIDGEPQDLMVDQ